MTTKKIFDCIPYESNNEESISSESNITIATNSGPGVLAKIDNIDNVGLVQGTKFDNLLLYDVEDILIKYNKTISINKKKGTKFNKDKYTIETFNKIKSLFNV